MIYSIMTIYQYSCDFIVEEMLIYCVLSNVLDLLIQNDPKLVHGIFQFKIWTFYLKIRITTSNM